jgi:small GTP-binding protein
VGKTTILQRYITRNYEQFTQPTVGSMFFCKKIHKGDKTYELQIWDTAGQEKFRSITPLYFRDANGVILVCDLTSQSSFNSLREWVKLLDEQGPKKLAKIILGNKVDLEDKLKVTEPELRQFAESVGSPYMLTSALNDTGIDQAFDRIIDNIEHFRTVLQGSMITTRRTKEKKKDRDCKC